MVPGRKNGTPNETRTHSLKFTVNFYPLTHPILAKTKNQIRLFFGEFM